MGSQGGYSHRALRRCATTGAGGGGSRGRGPLARSYSGTAARGGDGGWRDCSRGRDAALRGMGKMLQTCDEKNGEKFAKSLCKSYLCNELRDRTLN